MTEALSPSLSNYQEYGKLLSNSQRFQEALAEVYFDILMFLGNARAVCNTKGFLKSNSREVYFVLSGADETRYHNPF
jgi:hypothetical protein